MKKILMVLMFVFVFVFMSITAFAGTLDFGTVKGFVTIDNILAGIGVVSIVMAGTPVPKAGTTLWKVYSVLKYLGGNFWHADHTKKK